MGQYYKGQKIGTCENMYYMKLSEAKELAKQGAADEDGIKFEAYLKDNATRFRFPWPNEDEATIGETRRMNHHKIFTLPAGDTDIGHSHICISNAHDGGGYHINIMLPCPHSQDFKDLVLHSNGKLRTSDAGAGEQFLDVHFQAIRDGKEKTIFACARCGQEQRFDDDDVKKLKERAIEHYSAYKQVDEKTGHKRDGGNQSLYEYAMKVIERIK